MAFELSRVDRLTKAYDLAEIFPELTGPFTAASVALLAPRTGPTAATVWQSVDVADGVASVTWAGPDADSTDAVVVPATAIHWLKAATGDEVDAASVERIYLLGGGTASPLPDLFVSSVNEQTGAVTLDATDVGAATPDDLATGLATKQDAATLADDTAEHVADGSALDLALRATYGRAAPVLSDFSYDAATGDLLSYQEDGIAIVLTYNADGTVATSTRGDEPTQTYTYTGGNLTGVA